jgi:hypothetical protein
VSSGLFNHIPRVIIDTRKLAQLGESNNEQMPLLARYIRRIIFQRQDWNGEIISLRGSDIAHLALLMDCEEGSCLQMLSDRQLLLRTKS